MEHQPVTAPFENTGMVSASFKADLTSLPPSDAAIAAAITEKPGSAVQSAIGQAVTGHGYQLDAIAYTMDVAKNNMADGKEIGPATVTMSVPSSWVAQHGGPAGVMIGRVADDGTTQVLDTRYTGLDDAHNMVFSGSSPGGLSIFALISVKAPPEVIVQPPQPSAIPEPGTVPLANGAVDTLRFATPLIVLGIIFIARSRGISR
jgi:hypothetical protein